MSQEYYDLPKQTIRANGNIYHIFTPNMFRDIKDVYQDNCSMGNTLDEYKYLTSTCWDKKHQPLTIDMTKNKYTGRYRLGLKNTLVSISSPFKIS